MRFSGTAVWAVVVALVLGASGAAEVMKQGRLYQLDPSRALYEYDMYDMRQSRVACESGDIGVNATVRLRGGAKRVNVLTPRLALQDWGLCLA